MKVGARQRFSSPRRQNRQLPSVAPSQATPTRSPTANRSAARRSLRRRPTTSCPGVTAARFGGRSPSARWRSVRQTPQQTTRTSTWPVRAREPCGRPVAVVRYRSDPAPAPPRHPSRHCRPPDQPTVRCQASISQVFHDPGGMGFTSISAGSLRHGSHPAPDHRRRARRHYRDRLAGDHPLLARYPPRLGKATPPLGRDQEDPDLPAPTTPHRHRRRHHDHLDLAA